MKQNPLLGYFSVPAGTGSTMLLSFCFFILFLSFSSAQTAGDYRSKASTAWQLASTWETYDGSGWIAASAAPSATDGVITILPVHAVVCTTSVVVDQLVVSGDLVIQTVTGILNLADGPGEDLTINDFV